MSKGILEFPVTVYGKLERFNEVLSKARCRIFYKYANRNATYITDEFAEKLLSTLPYAPIKGIYEYDDYTDHGLKRSEGRIYGIVPESPNIAWEKHLDEDGVEREYACADVYIFSALYEEANEIVGKAQSMELYEPSVKYHKEIINGQKMVVFEEGCFLGLQVLGDDVEPCFEGAAFYSLQTSIEKAIENIIKFSKAQNDDGGNNKMGKLNFKLSDSQKYDALWTLLNTEYNQEQNWAITYNIVEVYDEYALIYNYEEKKFERVFYTKNDETDSVELGERETAYIIDVNEQEKNTVETLRKLNGETFSMINENLNKAEENAQEVIALNSKIEEQNNQISTLTTEKADIEGLYTQANTDITTLNENIENLNNQINDLTEYKNNNENKLKDEVIAQYASQLSEEVLDKFKAEKENYSVTDLDKELAYELKQTNPSVFSKQETGAYIPKDKVVTGIEAILAKYKK